MASETDVIVVGAGLSGLSAAVRLKSTDPNIRVVVLEAKDRIGGRTLSVRLKSARGNDVWDVGGQWVSSSQPHILQLLEELGLQTYHQNVDGTKLLQVAGQDVKSYSNSIPQISFLAALELHRFIQRVECLCQQISVEEPYNHPDAALLDGMTCESYKNQYVQSVAARELMDIAFRATFGCEAARISGLFLLWYSRSAGGMMRLFETSHNAAQEMLVQAWNLFAYLCWHLLLYVVPLAVSYIVCSFLLTMVLKNGLSRDHFGDLVDIINLSQENLRKTLYSEGRRVCLFGVAQFLANLMGGTQQICHLLHAKLGIENVLISHPVESIVQDIPREVVTVTTKNGRQFRTTKVIMAIPVSEAVKIEFTPALPEPRRALFLGMPMGHLTKFIVTYERPFWREQGFSGEIVSNGGIQVFRDCDTGPLGVVYDGTTFRGSPALVGFISGHQGIQWSVKTPEERKGAILHSLSNFFGHDAMQPIDFIEKIWSEELYNGGCPVNLATPGMMKYFGKHLRSPVGRIHWAGTETSTVWCGYMNGAVQAGWRAAKEILHDLRPGSMTEKDLFDTAYSPFTVVLPYQRQRKSGLSKIFQLAAMIGLLTCVSITLRRMYFRMAL